VEYPYTERAEGARKKDNSNGERFLNEDKDEKIYVGLGGMRKRGQRKHFGDAFCSLSPSSSRQEKKGIVYG